MHTTGSRCCISHSLEIYWEIIREGECGSDEKGDVEAAAPYNPPLDEAERNHSLVSHTMFPCQEDKQIAEGTAEQTDDCCATPGVLGPTPLQRKYEHDYGWGK